MNTIPTNFTFNTNTIRVVEIDGEPWFVAKDVCEALGMSTYGGTTQWTRGLDTDERRVVRPRELPDLFSGSRAGSLALISEPGLYKMIPLSRKPKAREFDRWVRHTVLPAIRKDGGYIAGEEKVATGEMSEDELVLKAMPSQSVRQDGSRPIS